MGSGNGSGRQRLVGSGAQGRRATCAIQSLLGAALAFDVVNGRPALCRAAAMRIRARRRSVICSAGLGDRRMALLLLGLYKDTFFLRAMRLPAMYRQRAFA